MAQITSQCPRQTRHARRTGLSLLELLGCLIAIAGGIWLGMVYLRVDMRRAVYDAMAQTEVLDKVPPEWRPVDPDGKLMREQMVSALREELGTLRSDIAELQAAAAPAEVKTEHTAVKPTASEERQRNTLAYWNRINEIVLGEADLQQDADSALNESSAARVFALKGRVSRFAARAVEAIPKDDVDPAVLQFGKQLEVWYDHGAALYGRAAQIWELPVASQRTNLTKRWTPAQLQRRNEAKLLSEKGTALREILSRRFGVEYPPFASPATTTPQNQEAGQAPAD